MRLAPVTREAGGRRVWPWRAVQTVLIERYDNHYFFKRTFTQEAIWK
jgi:hypothetical protein